MNRFSIDTIENTATLDLLVEGDPETVYNYANDVFTMAERNNPADLSTSGLAENITDILKWRLLVLSTFGLPETDTAPYDCSSEYKNNKLSCTLRLQNKKILDAEYNKNTQVTTFKPRQEFVLTPYEFSTYTKWLEFMYNDIRTIIGNS